MTKESKIAISLIDKAEELTGDDARMAAAGLGRAFASVVHSIEHNASGSRLAALRCLLGDMEALDHD